MIAVLKSIIPISEFFVVSMKMEKNIILNTVI